MAKRYPGASFQPLGPQSESRMTSHEIICIHTMVGTLAGTDAMFDADGYGGTESHFGTGGDGACIQWQDLAFSADANLDGWARVISIENADMGAPFARWTGSNVPRFSDPQAERLVDLLTWLCSKEAHAGCPSTWKCHREGIPARFVEDSKLGRRGIAVHRQGIDGNFPTAGPLRGRVSGGERWSSSMGKACPGDKRILQTVNEIIPEVQARLIAGDARTLTRGPLVDHALGDLARRRRTEKDPAVRRALRKARRLLKTLPQWVKKA